MDKDRNKYRILVIEDNPGDLLLIEDFLEEKMLGPDISHAQTYSEAREILTGNTTPYDAVLLDLTLPDAEREQLITAVVELSRGAPVLALTGYTDFDFSVKSLSMGVSDYLLKDELSAPSLHKSIVYSIERKKTVSKLRESEQRYSDLFHLSPQPMWVFDYNTLEFMDVNDAAVKQYGYTHEEFLKMNVTQIRPEEDIVKLKQSVETAKGNGPKSHRSIYNHRRKNGEIFQVEIQSNSIMFKGKRAEIVLANDVTERLKHTEKIESQNKKLREIAWVQSHVVRAPLARMMGLIDMIDDLEETGKSKNELLHLIEKSGRELDEIIHDITRKAQIIKSNDDV